MSSLSFCGRLDPTHLAIHSGSSTHLVTAAWAAQRASLSFDHTLGSVGVRIQAVFERFEHAVPHSRTLRRHRSYLCSTIPSDLTDQKIRVRCTPDLKAVRKYMYVILSYTSLCVCLLTRIFSAGRYNHIAFAEETEVHICDSSTLMLTASSQVNQFIRIMPRLWSARSPSSSLDWVSIERKEIKRWV